MSSNAIEFHRVSKLYRLASLNPFAWLKRKIAGEEHDSQSDKLWALRDISYDVPQGSALGIIGPNGAGKSTILKLLAGVSYADSGTITVNGRIAPLIELGAGFHPELTGRENVYLNGVLLGLSKQQINDRFDTIVDFAELWDFIDVPVKKYSSGMFIRLGFSLAVHTDPDILLIDEVLSVGDERFQRKCLDKFKEFREAGKTSVIVSHDLSLISNVCDKLLLLNHGRIIEEGPIDKTIGHYLTMVAGDIEGSAILKRDDVVAIFSNGKVSLYHQGNEVTKKWGVYTSVLIGKTADAPHLWIDSTKALWRCRHLSPSHVVCKGEFFNVPLSMEWDIWLDDENAINWNVVMMLSEPYHFERREANIMLSDKYANWCVNGKSGAFPPDFVSRDIYNWDILAAEQAESMSVMATAQLPGIELAAHAEEWQAVIVNSSFFFRGRVLRYLNLHEEYLPPARYNYFAGKIKITAL